LITNRLQFHFASENVEWTVDLGPDQLVLRDDRSIDPNVISRLLPVESTIRGRCPKDESPHARVGGDTGTQDAGRSERFCSQD
jgi:hypothetical protein